MFIDLPSVTAKYNISSVNSKYYFASVSTVASVFDISDLAINLLLPC